MGEQTATKSLDEKTIAIVGVGLIGGSIAAALKHRNFSGRIVGIGRNSSRLEAARNAGLIDEATTETAEGVAKADLVVFCTPVDRIVAGVLDAGQHCRAGTVLTDAGSVKQSLCDEIADRLPDGATFVGSHPLAGSEKQGFEHAEADLFVDRVCVVTPQAATSSDALKRVTAFWEFLGMRVTTMSADAHDRALAQTSHVPHVLSAALASTLSDENRSLTATGFRDTTRIAAGDPALWSAILEANADEIARGIDAIADKLAAFRTAIENRDSATLKNLLQLAKTNRENINDER